jgi:hypothetical protein
VKIAKNIFDRDNNVELDIKADRKLMNQEWNDQSEIHLYISITAVWDRFLYLNKFIIEETQVLRNLSNYILYWERKYDLWITKESFYQWDIPAVIILTDQLGRIWEKKILLRIPHSSGENFEAIPERIQEKNPAS